MNLLPTPLPFRVVNQVGDGIVESRRCARFVPFMSLSVPKDMQFVSQRTVIRVVVKIGESPWQPFPTNVDEI